MQSPFRSVPSEFGPLKHHKYYCEENAWQLLDTVAARGLDLSTWRVVFISNAKQAIPLWHHGLTDDPSPIVWDYHVICMNNVADDEWVVYDLDANFEEMPVDLDKYCEMVFRNNEDLREEYYRYLNIISGIDYHKLFTSDRSHMKDKDGEWVQSPPEWPCINEDSSDTIDLKDWRTVHKTESGEKYKMLLGVRQFMCDSDNIVETLRESKL